MAKKTIELKVGKRYRIKRYTKIPPYWSPDMKEWAGKEVTISSMYSVGYGEGGPWVYIKEQKARQKDVFHGRDFEEIECEFNKSIKRFNDRVGNTYV